MTEPQVGKVYQHYKGNRYRIVGIAEHTETGQKLVVYQSFSDSSELWARPLELFFAEVEWNGKTMTRFSLVSDGRRQLRETYNRIAEDWHKDHADDTWWIAPTEKFLSFLKPGSRVLDVGCGSGTKSRYMLERGMDVVGVDFSDKLVDIAKRENPSVDFRVMDMRDVAQLGRMFDGVFAQASLLHIPKSETFAVLTALRDILAPGGFLYVAVKEQRPGQPEEEVRVEDDYGYSYERFFSYYTLGELVDAFERLGVTVVQKGVEQSGKTNWLNIIGQKGD